MATDLSSIWLQTANPTSTNPSAVSRREQESRSQEIDWDDESGYQTSELDDDEEDDISLGQLTSLLVPILIPLVARAIGRYVTLRLLKVHVFGIKNTFFLSSLFKMHNLTTTSRRTFSTTRRVLGNYWDTLALDEKERSLLAQQKHQQNRSTKPNQPSLFQSPSSLAHLPSPPTNARLSARTFIHNSLYNPNYGYFSKNARIFSLQSEQGVEFPKLRDNLAFMNHVADLYEDFEKEGELDETMRQVWHTPTELFKPHYGNALANYIIKQHNKSETPAKPLKIYEIGAGNGTLARNILDFIQSRHPDLYARTEYTIIEISSKLAEGQTRRLQSGNEVVAKLGTGKRAHNVKIVNQSIFEYEGVVRDPCFVIAMEVIDNFSHDVVRYTTDTGTPVQGIVLVDEDGDYQEAFEPVSDPLIQRYLTLRDSWSKGKRPAVLAHPAWRSIRNMLPFSSNLTEREFLPTMNMLFLEKLHKNFPNHRLLLSDFDYLPDTVQGHTAPVVQTRYKGTMVPCSTYLVQPGWFDIFFPTNFEDMAKMYKSVSGRDAVVITQRDFLVENVVDVEGVRTGSGEVPMFDFYKNFKFIVS
ncbi:hypothetical protein HDU79_003528 [Rhizoclosmatium sp. JEL0117]|nr:hypothetical protein HDU79_003528 [Rhizoclosmatium sp. JEL0117]